MIRDFPKNQIKYILGSKWDNQKELEKTLFNFYYHHEKKDTLTKTDDLILLYVLGITTKAKKEFYMKFNSWKVSKDQEITYDLIKLFFLDSICNKGKFKKETISLLNLISEKDLTSELKPLYLFLQDQYTNNKIKVDNIITTEILSLIAGLFIFYNHNQMRLFYETQIKLIDLIEKQKPSIYEKIALVLFSENDKFKGIQLNKRDSLEYLRINSHGYFYKFIQSKFKEIFFKEYRLWLIPGVLAIFTILRFCGLLDFFDSYTGDFFQIKIPPYLIKFLFSQYNLLIIFFCSFIAILFLKLFIFFKRLREQ